jgi:hypothetical protein
MALRLARSVGAKVGQDGGAWVKGTRAIAMQISIKSRGVYPATHEELP